MHYLWFLTRYGAVTRTELLTDCLVASFGDFDVDPSTALNVTWFFAPGIISEAILLALPIVVCERSVFSALFACCLFAARL